MIGKIVLECQGQKRVVYREAFDNNLLSTSKPGVEGARISLDIARPGRPSGPRAPHTYTTQIPQLYSHLC